MKVEIFQACYCINFVQEHWQLRRYIPMYSGYILSIFLKTFLKIYFSNSTTVFALIHVYVVCNICIFPFQNGLYIGWPAAQPNEGWPARERSITFMYVCVCIRSFAAHFGCDSNARLCRHGPGGPCRRLAKVCLLHRDVIPKRLSPGIHIYTIHI